MQPVIARPLAALALAALAAPPALAASPGSTAVGDAGTELVFEPVRPDVERALLERVPDLLLARFPGDEVGRPASIELAGDGAIHVRFARELSPAERNEARRLVEVRGALELRILARPGDLPAADDGGPADRERAFAEEERRVAEWARANHPARLAELNALAPEEGGPRPGLLWYRADELGANVESSEPRFAACRDELVLGPGAEWVFTQADLAEVRESADSFGFPAIYFELQPARSQAFADFTEHFVDRRLAVVLDGEILSAATIRERLPGAALISGRFTEAEAAAWRRVLSIAAEHGPLPVALRQRVRPSAPDPARD